MVFQYHFNFTPNIRMEPALLKTTTQPSQMLRLSLDNLVSGRTVEIVTPQRSPVIKELNVGGNIFYIPIQKIQTNEPIKVQFTINGKRAAETITLIKPVQQREIYLIPYSHNDIGYTDLQPNIEKKQMKNIDDALRLIEKTKNYPPEAQFKWNMEVIWALESYLNCTTDEKRSEVISAIRNGSLGLNALYANVLTGLANTTEMLHFTEFARRFTKEYSIPITTACVSDIPGFTWGLVSALAQSGVKYFSSAPNSGDRVGFVYEGLGDKPFYWTSQSGEEKVLMWLAGASYSSFHEGELQKLGDEKILKMMRKLDDDRYPYSIVQLPYTVGGDNGYPDSTLSDFVKAWNERYESPRLIIATHEQLFHEFDKQYGATLPSLKGDFTPYWEDGAASTAYETALNRKSVDRLIQSEAILAMRAPDKFPEKEYYDCWRNVILWDEHTWGANISVSDPDSQFVKDQWRIKRQLALDADSVSRILLSTACGEPTANKNQNTIEVYNTSSWIRSDIVIIPKSLSTLGDNVIDDHGRKVLSQRLLGGDLAIKVNNLPALSSRKYFIRKGSNKIPPGQKIHSNFLENEFFILKIDPHSGIINSLISKHDNLDLCKADSSLNKYFYILGTNPDSAQFLSGVQVSIKEYGDLVSSIFVHADAPGCKEFSTEYRIYHGINRLDIINHVDKIAVREKEGVHFALPFNIPNGILHYDVANSIVNRESDQLPGSCKNFFSVQSVVDISNNLFGVTVATPDAPLIEIGAINAEKPWMKTIEQSQTFYSYVMNNYWHTNYKADQEGPVTFRYSITPHTEFRSENVLKVGMEQRQPLVVAPASGKPVSSLCTIEPHGIIINSIKPISGTASWLAEIYNASNKAQRASIHWNRSVPVVMNLSTVNGATGEKIETAIDIPAYGSRFIRIERKK